MSAKVIILGSTGFIGAALLESLRQRSDVVAEGYSSSTLDLTSPVCVDRLGEILGDDTILIVAARSRRTEDLFESFSSDIAIARNTARCLSKRRIKKCIYFSTLSVYGDAQTNLSITEETPIAPTSLYGVAKYAGECVVRQNAEKMQTSFLVLRPCMAYGPGDTTNAYGPTRFIQSILAEGKVYLFGDGVELRDYIFIDDLVQTTLQFAFSDRIGVYNLGSGKSISFQDILGYLKKIAERDFKVICFARSQQKIDQRINLGKLLSTLPNFYFTEFERQFANLCGVRYAVGVNSGTDALILALRSIGVGPGDEIITVPNSFVASTTCIKLVGARPVFVDVHNDYNIDPTKIAGSITPRTKAIIPVHLTGRPCDMDPIVNLAKEKGVHVIEDCAQSVMAEYKSQRVGSFGTIGCFSLHLLKTLNACGDGGVLTTNDPDLYEELKVLRNIGLRTRDDCVAWSHNSRLDTLQAAILLVKLRYLKGWTQRRRENAQCYQSHLANVPQVQVPVDAPHEKALYHTFVIQADRRDELRNFLAERGIGSSIHYPVPIHLSTVGKTLGYSKGSFPIAERQAGRILSLPVYPELKLTDLERVAGAVREFYGA